MKWDTGYFFPLAFILALAGGIISWVGGPAADNLVSVCIVFSVLSLLTWGVRPS